MSKPGTFIRGRNRKHNEFDNFIKSINIPIYRKKDLNEMLPIDIQVKKEIQPIMLPKEGKYILSTDVFNSVLKTIENCCLFMERVSITFGKLGEEDLRNVILTSLNTIFGCKALPEVFQKKGKTDIFIYFENNNAFIAECKKWNGINIVDETINQILGYLSWRETYGVIIMFSKVKNFSAILEKIYNQIPNHESYYSGLNKINDTHFEAKHKIGKDDKKLIEMHYLIYDLSIKE